MSSFPLSPVPTVAAGDPQRAVDADPTSVSEWASRPGPGHSDEPQDGNPDEPQDGNPDEPQDGNPDEPQDGNPDEPESSHSDEPEDGYSDQVAMLDRLSAELDAVDAALVRLDQQQFDRCAACTAPIGRERLLADPLLTLCELHASS